MGLKKKSRERRKRTKERKEKKGEEKRKQDCQGGHRSKLIGKMIY